MTTEKEKKEEILTDLVDFRGMECVCSNGKMYKLHQYCYFSTPVYANLIIEGDYIRIVLARRVGDSTPTL